MIIASHTYVVGTIDAVEDWFSTSYLLPGLGATALLVALHANNVDGSKVSAVSAVGTNGTDVANLGIYSLEQTVVHDSITGDERQLYRPGGAGATLQFAAPSPYTYLIVQVTPIEAGGDLTDVVVTLTSIAA